MCEDYLNTCEGKKIGRYTCYLNNQGKCLESFSCETIQDLVDTSNCEKYSFDGMQCTSGKLNGRCYTKVEYDILTDPRNALLLMMLNSVTDK